MTPPWPTSLSALTRARTAFLPDFCAARPLIVVILLAELLAIMLTLVGPGSLHERVEALALHSLFIQWTALSCVAILCLLRERLNRLADFWNSLASYLIMLAITLAVAEISWWLLRVWPAGDWYNPAGHLEFTGRILGISAIVCALFLRYYYVQHQWRRQIEAEAHARFEALQARIRPHFLFNCMNTIASLTRSDPALAEQAIEDLADLFRLNLADTGGWTTLAEELELSRRYLRIEQIRLGQRLRVDWDIATLPGEARLPALTLQPLLENAVYHGIEPSTAGGTIRISGLRRNGRLTIRIENPLPPITDTPPRHSHQMAQDNVRERLLSAFGDAELTVTQNTSSYAIILSFPYTAGHARTDR
jgi:two-component system sensor histidine kinase AlgZ